MNSEENSVGARQDRLTFPEGLGLACAVGLVLLFTWLSLRYNLVSTRAVLLLIPVTGMLLLACDLAEFKPSAEDDIEQRLLQVIGAWVKQRSLAFVTGVQNVSLMSLCALAFTFLR